ncbi:helix-hairpin-helix domain-containing protein [Photobacterium swingsii]
MKPILILFLFTLVLPISVQAASTDKAVKAKIEKCETKYKADKTKKAECIKKVKKASTKSVESKNTAPKKVDSTSVKETKSKTDLKADKSKAAAASSTTTKKALKAVNVNEATATELAASLPGVGDKKAQAIIDYRKKNGKFKSASDLEKVPGLGQKSVAGMKKYLKF